MILTRDQLKNALGIALNDATNDVQLDNAILLANGLIASYVGFDLSDTAAVREYDYVWNDYGERNFIHLPYWPVIEVVEIRDENQVLVEEGWRLIRDKGRIDFTGGVPYSELLTIMYRTGFDPLPADLLPVGINIAAAIYNNGGQIGTSTNALKSLTMFDAMSMSFDTTGGGNGPDSLVGAWAFILDRYSVMKGPALK